MRDAAGAAAAERAAQSLRSRLDLWPLDCAAAGVDANRTMRASEALHEAAAQVLEEAFASWRPQLCVGFGDRSQSMTRRWPGLPTYNSPALTPRHPAREAKTIMKRVALLVARLAVGSLSVALSAWQQAPGAAPSRWSSRSRSSRTTCSSCRGGGGNTAVFVTANGVTVVDTKNPGWGQPILDKIKELTDQAGHDDHQHAHARRPRERQRRVSRHRRHRHAREHEEPTWRRWKPVTGWPAGAAAAEHLQGEQRAGACRSGRSRTG